MELEQEIDRFVGHAMQAWNVPGLALAIVKDDQIIVAKGYGIREMDKPEPADEHTLFAIGSNTKAFTATAMGLLVQDGKVAWDDPVTKYLPTFRMYDPHTTQLLTIRDLLCHRAGLGTWAGDMLLMSKYSTEDIVRRIRHIPPEYGFRDGYGYCNLLFVTAGHVIEQVSGMSWDDFIQQRIFEPLGMTDSVTNPRYLTERNNVAVPHEDVKGNLQTVVQRMDAHVGAAGSIHASAADIAQWLRMQLAEGCIDGKQVVNPDVIAETRTPHTNIRLTPVERKIFPSRHFSAYGLGWFLSDMHGRFIVRHTGGVDGMLSSVVMIPEEKLGIAVFTNKLPNAVYAITPQFLTETLLGLEPRDWIQIYTDLEKEMKEKEDQETQKRDEARAKDTRPSLELQKYAGKYDSAIVGGATLSVEGDRLHIQLEAHETIFGTLEHWHYDTFLCSWDDPVLRESFIPFITDGQGNVVEFRVKIREDWLDPLEHVFRKIK
jgi:CubicO group peptidase (beta-lactamase class C family)